MRSFLIIFLFASLLMSCDPCNEEDSSAPTPAKQGLYYFHIVDSNDLNLFRDSTLHYLKDSIHLYSLDKDGNKIIHSGDFFPSPMDSIYLSNTVRNNMTLYIDRDHKYSYSIDVTWVNTECYGTLPEKANTYFGDSLLDSRNIFIHYR